MNTIIAGYTTQFGELWEQSLSDLIRKTVTENLIQANMEIGQVDAIFYGNMLSGILENNLHSSGLFAQLFDINIPVFRVEHACASGGVAFHLANQYLYANPNSTVLVVGAEKMTDFNTDTVTAALSSASSGEEQAAGITFPGLYALMAQYYLDKYNYTEETLAHVAVKNHFHGAKNSKAQFQRNITVQDVMKSQYVATPLKVLDSSPITDGAAAVILSNDNKRIKTSTRSINTITTQMATDTVSISKRKHIDRLVATEIAAQKAFKQASLLQKDISLAEVHDCFTIAELLAMEDIGFWKKGEAGKRITNGETRLDTSKYLVVNPSGGLKATGHPVGATGIKQLIELFDQLTGNVAEERLVKNARYGLAHNVGGSGGTVTISIFGI